MKRTYLLILGFCLGFFIFPGSASENTPRVAYLVSDARIPFWDILKRGIVHRGEELGFEVDVYSAENSKQQELKNTMKALKSGISGLIISPTNSSSAVTILKLAKKAGVPVVIADIGADDGDYISYIASDNFTGAYDLGLILSEAFTSRGWQDATVGIISIPQKRENGRARTQGFLRAIDEKGYRSAGLKQQVDFSYQETYDHAIALIEANPDLKGLWLQGSDRYQAALDAIRDAGKKGKILLLCFDAEPEFPSMLENRKLVGAGMQQPFLMGEMAISTLQKHLQGKPVKKTISLPVLAVSETNVDSLMPQIRRNVLGMEDSR
ncbi:sugar ABC transporter substrate-binding protein [Grimontia sp. AD028]|uniref:substrate-binding domain-containing protein n=1 Tax=Grimontia sp. AD028 TaxID=1581149 RepID=UPI00061B01CE|nr:substrate-binding domain-containing protein [Grimontia sp. AD028]KKD62340.1 sugar ABC transporter substrate-binding protein [Grimontia sp. AD028]